MTANTSVRVCRLSDVPDGDARGFEVDVAGDRRVRVIVARRGEQVFVYRNRCPHRGTPLDWMPDRFLDAEGRHLICATHGALFRFDDGVCVSGPCVGDALVSLDTRIEEGEVHVIFP